VIIQRNDLAEAMVLLIRECLTPDASKVEQILPPDLDILVTPEPMPVLTAAPAKGGYTWAMPDIKFLFAIHPHIVTAIVHQRCLEDTVKIWLRYTFARPEHTLLMGSFRTDLMGWCAYAVQTLFHGPLKWVATSDVEMMRYQETVPKGTFIETKAMAFRLSPTGPWIYDTFGNNSYLRYLRTGQFVPQLAKEM